MARNELVKRLVESHQRGDAEAFEEVAQELIDDERRKRHDSVADDLEAILEGRERRRPLQVSTLKALPTTRDDAPLLNLVQPRTTFRDVVLHPNVEQTLSQTLAEFSERSVLAAHGLDPRSRLLFVGPPGCGKSVTAEAVAHELGLPLAKVQLATVVSSYLGQTARHLDEILEFCREGTWVLLFDELDMFAKERGDTTEHGELRRVVAAFLQLLDDFRGDSLIIATSNHPALLDDAVWRRFHEVVGFDPPTQREIEELVRVKLRGIETEFSRREAARALKGMTHADIEMACHAAARTAVLEGRDTVDWDDIETGIQQLSRRRKEVSRFRIRARSSEATGNSTSNT